MEINPQEFGEVKAHVSGLKEDMAEVKAALAKLSASQEIITGQLSEAKGGWKMLMFLGGGAAAVGASFGAYVMHVVKGGPI